MMEMIANLCMCSFDSPCQQRKCIEWSMEDMDSLIFRYKGLKYLIFIQEYV